MNFFLLSKKAEMLAIECELHGLIAENTHAQNNGEPLPYREKTFVRLVHAAATIQNEIEEKRRA